ncbi:Cytochrome bd-II ubiquinol oxidase subunit 1 [Marinomonas gallaica]|uniref:Cytochrome bd-II ubiquinol oxidase subunit 1 n=1 Tax=Marinomonas gallaica TaxID=1806667 RepID=A0A1C3JW22_9GAMM|nr:cytochrome ubiquinol oxidase subunit I [Marinomonas gallaica]SBT19276.1 Cytochrome bd-II ubiquinol oxidase subunit 1 [Marinomonas gallaica]SBT20966.1 Cytochrome bd-II ubiquinol oxidase subunit 1 [Marinomonas gallaica]
MFDVSAIDLARIQFAFTVSFHIIFPAITIGLASYLAVLEGLWLKTRQLVYLTLSKFWMKIFAVNFAMGVVSGIVMAYQFGTNWSGFSTVAGSITGPLLTYEVLTAFFLEAGFLGVMLFGWKKVTERTHFVATCLVALGTLVSMTWILASNSWMQTPQGHEIVDGVVVPVSWFEIIFNPSFPYRLVHMGLAAFLCTALLVAATGAYHLLKKQHILESKKMIMMALWMLAIVAPLQALVGDQHGLNTLEHQPIKVAAMEGHWHAAEEGEGVPLVLFAWPDNETETNHFAVEIPHLASLILTHSMDGDIPALTSVAKEDRPNVPLVFWSFRVMVALGMAMIAISWAGLWLSRQQKLFLRTGFLKLLVLMGPTGLVALLAGWFVTEVGRQPWVVYGVLRTVEAASAHNVQTMTLSLISFVSGYFAVFGLGVFYLIKLLSKGPQAAVGTNSPTSAQRPARPLSAVNDLIE